MSTCEKKNPNHPSSPKIFLCLLHVERSRLVIAEIRISQRPLHRPKKEGNFLGCQRVQVRPWALACVLERMAEMGHGGGGKAAQIHEEVRHKSRVRVQGLEWDRISACARGWGKWVKC